MTREIVEETGSFYFGKADATSITLARTLLLDVIPLGILIIIILFTGKVHSIARFK